MILEKLNKPDLVMENFFFFVLLFQNVHSLC